LLQIWEWVKPTLRKVGEKPKFLSWNNWT